MQLTRRDIMSALGTASAGAALAGSRAGAAVQSSAGFPRKSDYTFTGTFLNAAYSHPMSRRIRQAGEQYLRQRSDDPGHRWARPTENASAKAKALFEKLINADPGSVAIVPSTLSGENLVSQTLRAGRPGEKYGVVTDAFHYLDSLVLYSELYSDSVPVRIARQRGNRIDLADIDALIDKDTKLVAVSYVASANGYTHDLKAVCDMAHAKGALVYADVIQAAGAVPLDVKQTGIDFCCAGGYKWLMGDFGPAFLYVRPDRLPLLKRVQLGWQGIPTHAMHLLPLDPPGPPQGEWTLGTSTSSIFEVSTPAFGPLAILESSLTFLNELGVDAIARHRQPMIDRLQQELPRIGFDLITPEGTTGPIAAFSFRDALNLLPPVLAKANITVQLYDNVVRVSPSIYNDMSDIDRLIAVFRAYKRSS